MKRVLILWHVMMAAGCAVFLTLLLTIAGCKTTPAPNEEDKLLRASSNAVDHCLKGWERYCKAYPVEHSLCAGVEQAYQNYLLAKNNAFLVFEESTHTRDRRRFTDATNAMLAAEDVLIDKMRAYSNNRIHP